MRVVDGHVAGAEQFREDREVHALRPPGGPVGAPTAVTVHGDAEFIDMFLVLGSVVLLVNFSAHDFHRYAGRQKAWSTVASGCSDLRGGIGRGRSRIGPHPSAHAYCWVSHSASTK